MKANFLTEGHQTPDGECNCDKPPDVQCAACGGPASKGNHSIHRDGFGLGPEVDLCHGCGAYETPSCPELWERIAQRRRSSNARKAGKV